MSMIRAIDSYNPNFSSRTKFAKNATKKVVRNVVNLEKSSLNGISKTPVRLAQKVDPDSQVAISGLVSSATAVFASWMAIL